MADKKNYLQKELYHLVREDQSIFEFIQQGSLDGLWYWDLEKPENEWMSPQFWATLGYDPQDKKHLASEWQDLIHPDDLKVALDNFHKHCADPHHPYDQIVRYRHKDGSTVWVRCRGIAIRDKAGKPIRMLGAHIDLTAQKNAEQALRESEEKYKFLTEHSADVIYKVDIANEQYTYASPSAQQIFGYSAEEILSLKVRDTLTPESYAQQRQELEKIPLEGGQEPKIMEVEILHKDGHKLPVEIHAVLIFDDQGIPVEILGVARDITVRKKAERALADSQKRLSDIIEFLPDPTWVIDTDGRVIAWNRAIERTTGIQKQEILGQGDYAYALPFYGERRPVLIDLVLKRDVHWEQQYLSLKEEDGMIVQGESFNPAMGENGRYLAATASRLYNLKGDVVGAIESVRDITAAKRSEQERERLIVELQEAIAKVRTLSGLLPICSSCKKIRDDKGYWNQIESYISRHSSAEFSHGICPECAQRLYPGLVNDEDFELD